MGPESVHRKQPRGVEGGHIGHLLPSKKRRRDASPAQRGGIRARKGLGLGLLGVLVASLSWVLDGWLFERLYRETMERLYWEIGYWEIEKALGPVGLSALLYWEPRHAAMNCLVGTRGGVGK